MFTLSIDLENDAFDPDPRPELVRLLRQTALRVEANPSSLEGSGKLMDNNGNTVGSWTLSFND